MSILERRNEFNRRFEQRISAIQRLLSAYDALIQAQADITILKEHFDEMDDNTRSAFSRAFVTTYAKPFTTDKAADNEMMSVKYLTRNPKFDHELHGALMDLRNGSIAHKSRDRQDSRIFVSEAVSDIKGGKPKVGRVCVPYAFWYLSTSFSRFEKGEGIEKTKDHVDNALDLTGQEIEKQTTELQDFMLEYADVCDRDARVIIMEEDAPIPGMDSSGQVFGDNLPKNKFPKKRLMYRNVSYRTGRTEKIEYDGEDFSIRRISGERNGQITLTVSFKNIVAEERPKSGE